jgi:integrase
MGYEGFVMRKVLSGGETCRILGIHPRTLSRRVPEGIVQPARTAHDLRRSFGQRMADAGIPPRDLQAIMRHASLTTTEKYYLRHRASDQAERIAAYLGTSARINAEQQPEELPETVAAKEDARDRT